MTSDFPTMFMHSTKPPSDCRDDLLAFMTQMLNLVEEEYLHTLQLTPQWHKMPSGPWTPLQAAPQLQPTYIPPWPTAQSGPWPPISPAQPAPQHQCLCTCTSHTSLVFYQVPPAPMPVHPHLSHHLQHHPNLQPSHPRWMSTDASLLSGPLTAIPLATSCTWPQYPAYYGCPTGQPSMRI